jgi:hypothetical protein
MYSVSLHALVLLTIARRYLKEHQRRRSHRALFSKKEKELQKMSLEGISDRPKNIIIVYS